MADPRTFTVKQCQPAYAAKSGAGIASSTSTRRDFFSSLGKVGDLSVLNSVGGGSIGKGLRNLASISNSIRTGCGSLPTSIGSSIEAGANWVLEQTGIANTVVDALKGFNPAIANQGFGQAKAIYEKVKQGNFKTTDIPNFMQDLQNLERLGRNIFTPGAGDAATALGERCEASPYAVDLVARAPKFKFLFVVQFVPESGYGPLGGQDFGPLDMAFTVKHSTRPNIRFQTEDVNYYNFRSKVVTKTEFEEMSMTFHDDTLNLGTQFYKAYLQAMAPITSWQAVSSDLMEQLGMDFVGSTQRTNEIINQIPADATAASHGTLADDRKQIFKEIVVYHLFDNGNRMNVYRFFNPRISQMNLDDLDMSIGSEGNEISINFAYDSVFIDPDVSVSNNGGKYNLGQTQRGAVYPLRNNSSAGTSVSGINPYGSATTSGAISCDPMQPIDTRSGGGIGGGISSVPAVGDLSTKFSKALDSFSLF